MQPNVVIGKYTGTGATVKIELGFVPDHVEIINCTDGDNKFTWVRGAVSTNKVIREGAVSLKLITDGIAVMEDATDNNLRGFMALANVSENAKVFAYKATRSSAGKQNALSN